MVEAIGAFGRGLRGPSPYEMSGPFLQKRKQKVLDGFKSHEESWKTLGCTLMTDAWTDKKGRGVMNLVVHSAHVVLFFILWTALLSRKMVNTSLTLWIDALKT